MRTPTRTVRTQRSPAAAVASKTSRRFGRTRRAIVLASVAISLFMTPVPASAEDNWGIFLVADHHWTRVGEPVTLYLFYWDYDEFEEVQPPYYTEYFDLGTGELLAACTNAYPDECDGLPAYETCRWGSYLTSSNGPSHGRCYAWTVAYEDPSEPGPGILVSTLYCYRDVDSPTWNCSPYDQAGVNADQPSVQTTPDSHCVHTRDGDDICGPDVRVDTGVTVRVVSPYTETNEARRLCVTTDTQGADLPCPAASP